MTDNTMKSRQPRIGDRVAFHISWVPATGTVIGITDGPRPYRVRRHGDPNTVYLLDFRDLVGKPKPNKIKKPSKHLAPTAKLC